MQPGLVLENASFRYGTIWVLLETNLRVSPGETLVLTGENGVGKSTLLYLLGGLLPATTGRVLLDGEAPNVTRPSELVRKGIRRGFVFQHGGLFANLTALDNVLLALRYHADVLGLDEAGIAQRGREVLRDLRVSQHDFHTLPAYLSVGVRQRVGLARALAIDPNFVFLDDPDQGLDESTRELVLELLVKLRDEKRITLVLTTTDPEVVARLGVRALELNQGRLTSMQRMSRA
ncbi:MAG TPA: ATP-binding cassette domain-containing protein [Polyangiaceae bacterium]|nr:ATP-binding cassette domain-containing protein [Polyangiaceae bacterium]